MFHRSVSVAFLPTAAASAATGADRPNVLFIIADDMGAQVGKVLRALEEHKHT